MRRLTVLLALCPVLLVAVLTARPADAHAAVLTGIPSCNVDGVHVIAWTITNDFDLPMTIDTATTPFGAATGYTSPVTNLGQTSASSTAPGATTGPVTLTVHATWTDEFDDTFTGTVNLPAPCPTTVTTTTTTSTTSSTTTIPPDTTTTTSPPETSTTQTPPTSSTTLPPDTTTTIHPTTTTSTPPPSTTGPPPSSTTPPPPPLPWTGSDSTPLGAAGIAITMLGGAIVATVRRRPA